MSKNVCKALFGICIRKIVCMVYTNVSQTLLIFNYPYFYLLSTEPWAAVKKAFKLMRRCHQFLSGFLANGPLSQVSRQSLFSANTGYIELKAGAVLRSPGIYFMTEENCVKLQPSNEAFATSHRIKWDVLLPNIVRIAQQAWEVEDMEGNMTDISPFVSFISRPFLYITNVSYPISVSLS